MLLYSRNSARVTKFSGRRGWNSREGKSEWGFGVEAEAERMNRRAERGQT